MRHIIRLGIVTLVASTAVAVLGASSAMATEATILCKKNEQPCKPENRYQPPTTLKAKLKKSTTVKLKLSEGTLECTESTWEGKTTAEGEFVTGTITSMSFSGCTLGEAECFIGPTSLPIETKTLAVESGNGTMTLSSNGGDMGIAVECGEARLPSCSLTGKPALTLFGGNPALLEAKEVSLSGKSGLCAAGAKLSAIYELILPAESMFASIGKTVLCKASEAICSGGNTYAEGSEVKHALEKAATFKVTSGPTVKCPTSNIRYKTKTPYEGLPVEFTSFAYSGCTEEGTGFGCTVTVSSTSDAKVVALAGGSGTLRLLGVTYTIECPLLAKCAYSGNVFFSILTGKTPVQMGTENEIIEPVSGQALCKTNMTMTAKYEATEPKSFFVTG